MSAMSRSCVKEDAHTKAETGRTSAGTRRSAGPNRPTGLHAMETAVTVQDLLDLNLIPDFVLDAADVDLDSIPTLNDAE